MSCTRTIQKILMETDSVLEFVSTANVGSVPDAGRVRIEPVAEYVVSAVDRGNGFYDLIIRNSDFGETVLGTKLSKSAALQMGQSVADLYGGIFKGIE